MMNICGELSESTNISGELFKQVIAGEPIMVQYKGRDGFETTPRATHWFASNHAPKSQDTSDGFTRRWLFLEFNRKVPAHLKVTDIADDVLANEREAIAAWAVQAVPGMRDYTIRPRRRRWSRPSPTTSTRRAVS
jgi:phage/plasmid-associated DNA primase